MHTQTDTLKIYIYMLFFVRIWIPTFLDTFILVASQGSRIYLAFYANTLVLLNTFLVLSDSLNHTRQKLSEVFINGIH